MPHPFLDLATEALNQLHPRFAGKGLLAYPPADADGPAAARKERERPFVREFYHQFRRLWDKALPVRLGSTIKSYQSLLLGRAIQGTSNPIEIARQLRSPSLPRRSCSQKERKRRTQSSLVASKLTLKPCSELCGHTLRPRPKGASSA